MNVEKVPTSRIAGVCAAGLPCRSWRDLIAGIWSRDGRRFMLYLIKPSHYDDDGYVIQWLRSAIPSNTLAVMHGLARRLPRSGACSATDVEIEISAIDETNTRIRPRAHRARHRAAGGAAWSAWSACSRTSFRARWTSRGRLRARGVPGRASAGSTSRAASRCCRRCRPRLKEAQALGVSLFAGEAEGRLERCCATPAPARCKPLYNYMDDLPGLEGAPIPILPARQHHAHGGRRHQFRRRARLSVPMLVLHHHQRAGAQVALSLAGRRRGDHARQSRAGHRPFLHHRRQFRPQQGLGADLRPPDRDARAASGSTSISSSRWTRCATAFPRFIEKAARGRRARACSSASRTSIRTACVGAKKKQNRIAEYRDDAAGLEEAPAASPTPATSSAFPADTPETIVRDIEIIQRELPLDLLEFFCLTPLPGSEDHKRLAGRRGDGCRPQQIRPRACRHRPCDDVEAPSWERAYRAGLGRPITRPSIWGRVMRRAAPPASARAR